MIEHSVFRIFQIVFLILQLLDLGLNKISDYPTFLFGKLDNAFIIIAITFHLFNYLKEETGRRL